jgi:hypothetical protein
MTELTGEHGHAGTELQTDGEYLAKLDPLLPAGNGSTPA